MKKTSFQEHRNRLDSRQLSVQELVSSFLHNIDKGKATNAIIEAYSKEALQRADVIQKKIETKKAGKLAGMVLTIKDNICWKNHRLNCASKILASYISPYSSTIVQRLLAHDAIIIARSNCDEFMMGSKNENSCFGPVKNALDSLRVAGGSSGGAAVSVAKDMCHCAIGTDTGGSVRLPAGFNNVYGIRPTYGRVSRWGLVAFASSFDQAGILAYNLDDLALVLEVIAGKDNYDSTLSLKEVDTYSQGLKINKKIAYYKDILEMEGLNDSVKSAYKNSIDLLKENGWQVSAVSCPYLEYLVPTYYILTSAEASSNLSRFDGIRYGYRTLDAEGLIDLYKKSRSEGFGPEVKRRIMLGTFVLSAGYFDDYYVKAQKVRRLIYQESKKILSQYDYVLYPTSPSLPYPLGKKDVSVVENYLADVFTVQSALIGFPCISLPTHRVDGLPIGMQLMCNPFQERGLIHAGKEIMKYFMV